MLFLESFSHLSQLTVFHWKLSGIKSPQVSSTLPSILDGLNNAVAVTISTHSVISKSSSLYKNPLVTVSKAPITTGITIIFMFDYFFNPLARSWDLFFFLSFFFSLSFNFTLGSARTAKSTLRQVLFFVNYYKVWSAIRLYIKVPEEFVSFSNTDSGLCI